jgi:hypothetical protein
MHPKSEDAFVVISGSGHLVESESTRSISGLDAVWVPPGNAHGLTTGHEGILEIGCQVPPDEVPIEVRAGQHPPSPRQAVIASIKPRERNSNESSWAAVFPAASHQQALQLFSASLSRSDELLPPAGAGASAIIVVRGAARFGAHTLRALGVAVYVDEPPASIVAQEDDTLLVSLLAFPEALYEQKVGSVVAAPRLRLRHGGDSGIVLVSQSSWRFECVGYNFSSRLG